MIRDIVMMGEESTITPTALFANSEVGVWFDPSNKANLFQDSAGTIPVTAVNDPVGKMLDLSGNGLHATQATSAKRPLYKENGSGVGYLYFDGVDDGMSFGSLGGGLLRKVWGVWKLRNTGTSCVILELSINFNSNPGAFLINREFGSPLALSVSQRGTTHYNISYNQSNTLETLQVDRIEIDRQTSSDYTTQRKLWVNSAQQSLTPLSSYITNMQNTAFYNATHFLGSRDNSDYYSHLDLYGLIIVNAIHDTGTKTAIDQYWMNKVGL